MSQGYLTAKQASQRLGVSLSTLYAYVSRGLIHSEPDVIRRRRRYRVEDVESLLARKSERSAGDKKLAQALSWGEPICESELTLIEDGEFYYRGKKVGDFLEDSSFEDVIDWLWGAYHTLPSKALPLSLQESIQDIDPMDRFQSVLPWLARHDERAFDLRPEAVRETGARILHALFSTLCEPEPSEHFAAALARQWCPGHRREIETALILCADHELNVSAFTARCVASAGSTPYQVVIAALAALSGFRHGGHGYSVEALFREVEALGPEGAVRSYLRRGMALPGFGHPLYPQGDPRARHLLKSLSSIPGEVETLIRSAEALLGEAPNIDFALIVLSRCLKLPSGGHLAIFALGRCAGWIAHAIEQYRVGRLIRPRARYLGPLPNLP